jgi:hypothetical protein
LPTGEKDELSAQGAAERFTCDTSPSFLNGKRFINSLLSQIWAFLIPPLADASEVKKPAA